MKRPSFQFYPSDVAARISAHGVRQGCANSIHTKWGEFNSVVVKARFGERLGEWAMRSIRRIDRLQSRMNCAGAAKKRAGA